MAKHNAKLYGVDHRIEFIVGNFLTLADSLIADVIFLSPPLDGSDSSKVNFKLRFSSKFGLGFKAWFGKLI